MALNGWHSGERLIHKKLGHEDDYDIMNSFRWIEEEMPEQHSTLYSTRLPFMAIAILDESGRPWGSIIAGSDGQPGFIRLSRYDTLTANVKPLVGDPLARCLSSHDSKRPMLLAGIGIEFSTRRRDKLAGLISRLKATDRGLVFDIQVKEAIGNCPKYINVRDIVPHPDTSPVVTSERLVLDPGEELPDEVISFILNSDTVFLGTTYEASDSEASKYPSHLGMNQRGGRKGFIRVLPSDKRTVILPDFSGNRIMTSLGNIEATPRASLTFLSFTTGDVLYLTGDAKNLVNEDAQRLMPFQNILTAVHVTGFVHVRNSLPVRQRPGTVPQPSPYSPPLRFLAEEAPTSTLFSDTEKPSAKLTQIELHSPTIATFTWGASEDLTIIPGQAAILDFTPLLGKVPYQHMSPLAPTSVNDDRMRTWTVSRTDSGRNFSLTMREKPGGAVTGALFSIARKIAEAKPELLADASPLNLSVTLAGITGDFVLHDIEGPVTNGKGVEKLLWIAGGIGITPFLAMLPRLPTNRVFHINMVLATREPSVLMLLLETALAKVNGEDMTFCLDVISNEPIPDFAARGVVLRKHTGRISQSVFAELRRQGDDLKIMKTFICGPTPFEETVIQLLGDVGVQTKSISRENFTY